MSAIKVKSGKTGRTGWRFRFTSPVTKVRTYKTVWFSERREADKAFKEHLESLEARRIGLPDNSGWELRYADAVKRFLADAPIPTTVRRDQLKLDLERNLLKLHTLADLGNIGTLTAKCHRLLDSQKDVYVIKSVQQPIKQLAAWCASVGLLPYNPIAAWKKLRRSSEAKKPRAFLPAEMRAILAAAEELDQTFKRRFSSAIIFKTLLVTGNRPTALFEAKVSDLDAGRIKLPSGNGTKRNGVATIPPTFETELRAYVSVRDAKDEDPLLVSPNGKALDTDNINDDFRRAEILAFVRQVWPNDNPATADVAPIEVASLIFSGKRMGFDGAPPRDPVKLAKREKKITLVDKLARELTPEVNRLLKDRPMYALRATHISWARNIPVNGDSVKAQVGHAPRDIEEKHYLDQHLIDPHESSQAVWELLTGARELRGKHTNVVKLNAAPCEKLQIVAYKTAYVAKNNPTTFDQMPSKIVELVGGNGVEKVEDTGIEPVTFRLPEEIRNKTTQGAHVDPNGLSLGERDGCSVTTGTVKDRNGPSGGLQNGLHRIECADLAELAALWKKIPQTVRESWLVTARMFVNQ